MDPAFTAVMDETQVLLRETFATRGRATLPLTGSSGAGMEAAIVNFVDPGDRVVCGVAGMLGERLAGALARAGAEVIRVEGEFGRALEPGRLVAAMDGGCSALAVVHGESSTGVAQPLDGLGAACREHDALLLLDCATSLGGQALRIDEAQVDVGVRGEPRLPRRAARPCTADRGRPRAAQARAAHPARPLVVLRPRRPARAVDRRRARGARTTTSRR